MDPPIRNSKYAFRIEKSIIEKKSFWIHQSVIEIRLPDSAIWKSTIYANFAFRTPLIQKTTRFTSGLMNP